MNPLSPPFVVMKTNQLTYQGVVVLHRDPTYEEQNEQTIHPIQRYDAKEDRKQVDSDD